MSALTECFHTLLPPTPPSSWKWGQRNHFKLVLELMELYSWKRLCECIIYLICCWNMLDAESFANDLFTNSRCLVLECNTRLGVIKTALWLSHNKTSGWNLMFSSLRSDCTQRSSVVALASPRYSASALDRATRVCFLELHEMRLGPRYRQESEVDLRSSESLAQSESL